MRKNGDVSREPGDEITVIILIMIQKGISNRPHGKSTALGEIMFTMVSQTFG